MAQLTVPINVNLPENWLDLVTERVKQDGDYVLVTRCKDCKHRHEAECPMYHEEDIEWDDDGYIERETIYHDWTEDDGYCDRGERKEDGDTD